MLTTDRGDSALEDRIERAARALIDRQQSDGHWVFELEADATIPAEYVLMRHFRGEPLDAEIERKIAVYLRRIQGAHGGWPLFHEGAFDMSASVKAYFALKMIGDSIDADHMRRAREAIRARGGAARANVFTRTLLALYGQISWRAVPMMPAEVMLLPKWFPFHLDKISYWSRTVIVPLLVLLALKPRAKNAKGVRIDELFLAAAGPGAAHAARAASEQVLVRVLPRGRPRAARDRAGSSSACRRGRRAIKAAEAFTIEHLNGEDGIGAIFPAMVNSVLMFDVLGYPADHPACDHRPALGREAPGGERGRGLLPALRIAGVGHRPCLPRDARGRRRRGGGPGQQEPRMAQAPSRSSTSKATGRRRGPTCGRAAGRSSTTTPHYPDVDDTAVVAMAWTARRICRARPTYREPIARAREWIFGMQSKNGGWGAFDADNDHYYLNHIPFADHGALLDPPTEDVSARCVSMLAQLGDSAKNDPRMAQARRLSAQVAASGGQLVRPLGHELHLRHLVGAVRAQHRRRRPQGARRSARRSTGW